MDAFTYSVSHDLRAPLRGIQGFANALLEDYGEQLDSLSQDYVQRIIAGAQRMDTLIRDLLAYSNVKIFLDILNGIMLHFILFIKIRNIRR